jgi:hypothetical protein
LRLSSRSTVAGLLPANQEAIWSECEAKLVFARGIAEIVIGESFQILLERFIGPEPPIGQYRVAIDIAILHHYVIAGLCQASQERKLLKHMLFSVISIDDTERLPRIQSPELLEAICHGVIRCVSVHEFDIVVPPHTISDITHIDVYRQHFESWANQLQYLGEI